MRLVRERDCFVCDYCGSFYFPEENPDGLRILNEPADTVCPVCKTTLVAAALDNIRVLHCLTCKSVLIEQSAFALAVEYLRKHSAVQSLPQPLIREELE